MRVATDQRESADDRQLPPEPPPRLGGTDLFRGAMVILAAVIIGGLVLSRGIDDDTTDVTESIGETDQSEVDLAAGGTTGSTVATVDPGTATATATDPATGTLTDAGATPTVPTDDSVATDNGTETTTETTSPPVDTIRAPSEVRTLVLNAGGPQGIAGRATELLLGASYVTSAAKNADINGPSAIYYAEGYQAEALAVGSVFGPGLETLVQPLNTVNPPSTDLQQATVIVVVGTDGAIVIP